MAFEFDDVMDRMAFHCYNSYNNEKSTASTEPCRKLEYIMRDVSQSR
jgi:hypothetical protein